MLYDTLFRIVMRGTFSCQNFFPSVLLKKILHNSSLRKVCNVSACVHYNLPKDHTCFPIFKPKGHLTPVQQSIFSFCASEQAMLNHDPEATQAPWTVSLRVLVFVFMFLYLFWLKQHLKILMKRRHTELNLGATVPCVCMEGNCISEHTRSVRCSQFHRKQ